MGASTSGTVLRTGYRVNTSGLHGIRYERRLGLVRTSYPLRIDNRTTADYIARMPDEDLAPTPGSDLAELRRSAGVGQQELADRLGMHRVTLSGLENAPTVDVIRSARYRKALRELVAEATEGTAA